MSYPHPTSQILSPPLPPTSPARLREPSKLPDVHQGPVQTISRLASADGFSRAKTATQFALNNADVLNHVLQITGPQDFRQLRAVSKAFRDVFDSPSAWAKQFEPASIHYELRTIYTSSQAAWVAESAYQHKILRKTYRNESWTIKQGPPPKTPTTVGDLEKLELAWDLNILQRGGVFVGRDDTQEGSEKRLDAVYCALLHRGYLRAHGQAPRYSIPPVASFFCATAVAILSINYLLAPWALGVSKETTSWSRKLSTEIVFSALVIPTIVLNGMIAAGTIFHITYSVPAYIELNRLSDIFYNAAIELPYKPSLPQDESNQSQML